MLSFYPGLVFGLILLSVPAAGYVLDRQGLSPVMRQETIDAPGAGIMLLFLVLLITLSEFAALFLGAAALLRDRQRGGFAWLGVATSASILLLSVVQNVVWTPLSGYAVP